MGKIGIFLKCIYVPMHLMTFWQKESLVTITQRSTRTYMGQSRTSMIISEMEKILINRYDNYNAIFLLVTFWIDHGT